VPQLSKSTSWEQLDSWFEQLDSWFEQLDSWFEQLDGWLPFMATGTREKTSLFALTWQ
jgi:hypothetical protein